MLSDIRRPWSGADADDPRFTDIRLIEDDEMVGCLHDLPQVIRWREDERSASETADEALDQPRASGPSGEAAMRSRRALISSRPAAVIGALPSSGSVISDVRYFAVHPPQLPPRPRPSF